MPFPQRTCTQIRPCWLGPWAEHERSCSPRIKINHGTTSRPNEGTAAYLCCATSKFWNQLLSCAVKMYSSEGSGSQSSLWGDDVQRAFQYFAKSEGTTYTRLAQICWETYESKLSRPDGVAAEAGESQIVRGSVRSDVEWCASSGWKTNKSTGKAHEFVDSTLCSRSR